MERDSDQFAEDGPQMHCLAIRQHEISANTTSAQHETKLTNGKCQTAYTEHTAKING